MASVGSVIVVIGATGDQGGGAAKALLQQGKFKVRAITRNPQGQAAQELASRGAEVVKADLDEKESLVKALEGAEGLFLVTDFFGAGTAERELAQGRNAVDAAKQAGIKHTVFSALEDPRPAIKGGIPEVEPGRFIPHLESKGEIAEYIKSTNIPATILMTSIFYQNFLKYTQYQKADDGTYAFSNNMGTGAQPHHDVNDIGSSAAVAFSDPAKYVGATVPVVGEHLSLVDAAKVLSNVTGQQVSYVQMPDAVARSLPFPAALDLSNMYQFYRENGFLKAHRPLDKVIYKGISFRQWALENKEALKAQLSGAA